MNILQILSHPDYDNSARTANYLAVSASSALTKKFPAARIETLNLYAPETVIPQVDKDFVNGTWTDEKLSIQRRFLDQFKAADMIFFFTPLHNFNVTAKMKDYLDNILIAGETFKYTAEGSVGLLSDAKKVTLVLTSGSDYSTNYRYINMDIAPQYMRVILSVMGINEMKLIRAQGLDIQGNDKPAIVEKARQELINHIGKL